MSSDAPQRTSNNTASATTTKAMMGVRRRVV